MDLTKYIRDIPDFPKPGILFKDITPLLADPDAFQYAIDRLAEHYRGRPWTPSRPSRRAASCSPPRWPCAAQAADAAAQAGQAALPHPFVRLRPGVRQRRVARPHRRRAEAGARVLLVDDLLATGGTMKAGCQLVEKAGGEVVGCAFLVELTFLEGRAKLKPHEVFSLIRY